LKNSVITVRR